MMFIKLLPLLFLTLLSKPHASKDAFVTGNIFFCSYADGDMSAAIDAVTQTDKQTNYSHMGVIEMVKSDTFLIHATPHRGVVRDLLSAFLAIDQPSTVDIYTLPQLTKRQRELAVQVAKSKVGLPYNTYFTMNDSSFYCSQLVYEAYSDAFILEPMTFKNSESETFNEGWVDYYQNLGVPIPEGEMGCNPNGMIAHSPLLFVERL